MLAGPIRRGVLQVAVVAVEVLEEGITDHPARDDEKADSIMGTINRRVRTDS